MKINIIGDFKVNDIRHLRLDSSVREALRSAAVNVVNFEAPVRSGGHPIEKSGPSICQDAEAPNWLEQMGFNAISLANNHTMDYGEEGLEKTTVQFRSATLMGAGKWEQAYRIHTFKTEEGMTIGIIACTHCEFGTLTEPKGVGCAWSLSPEICRLISKGKDDVDYLIVMPHGGVEYMEQPLPEWREIYQLWIDLGADAVVASHPHVPQGWELYKGKPICYSLGNFCFDSLKKGKTPDHWYESYCCRLIVTSPHTASMEMVPLIYDEEKRHICHDERAERSEHMQAVNYTLQDKEKYMQYVDATCKRLLPFYMGQFSRSGWVTSLCSKGLLKGLAEGVLGRGFFSKVHALNNIQCESHRWAILRGLKNK